MLHPKIVIDTNVLVAGLRSRRGYSHELLKLVGTSQFEINLSVPLVMEYESSLRRLLPELGISERVMNAILDYHCLVAHRHDIFFLWRPVLPDPEDDMVLELAVKAGCDFIVTFNKRDFRGAEAFGIKVVDPKEFLELIERHI